MDDLCNPPGSLASGIGEQLHAGRIYSSPPRRRGGSADSSVDIRAADSLSRLAELSEVISTGNTALLPASGQCAT